jgi:hypothetical protein
MSENFRFEETKSAVNEKLLPGYPGKRPGSLRQLTIKSLPSRGADVFALVWDCLSVTLFS